MDLDNAYHRKLLVDKLLDIIKEFDSYYWESDLLPAQLQQVRANLIRLYRAECDGLKCCLDDYLELASEEE